MANTSGSRSPDRAGYPRVALLVMLLVAVGACARPPTVSGPFPAFSEFQNRNVDAVSFSGDLEFPVDSLRAVIRTRASRCRLLFLPICLPFTSIGREEYRLDLTELARDVARLQLYHRDHGFYGARIAPTVEDADDDQVAVEFMIEPGRPVILRDLAIDGLDTIMPAEELLDVIPLRLDRPFGRADFFASADTIQNRLRQRGFAYADVLRNFALDTVADIAEAQFVTIPGPIVNIDTIVFEGNERLTEETLRRHITIAEGQVLRNVELGRTQRNLYNLDMVNFAAVRLAPDTLQQEQEQEQATVLVQIVEAAQYAVEAAAGFGTVECLRTNGQWINRNFLGGGRRLELSGSVARIGVGSPVDLGLERSVCSALGEEAFLGLEGLDVRDRIDYTVRANLQQPSIFGTENRLAVNLHADRISEPDAYIRESVGGSVSAVRQFEFGQTVVTTTALVDRGRTIASPAILCVGFDTCTQDDFDLLTQARWSNSLALGAVRDRTRSDVGGGTQGYLARGTIDWASTAFGSDDSYLRLQVEGSAYRPLRPGWTLAGNLRVGRFIRGLLGPDVGYIPPEQRFYAGGPNSVRGYGRNGLGPTSYVVPLVDGSFSSNPTSSATGGTQIMVSSVELRIPSPLMSQAMRLAFFVDAGHVSTPGSGIFSPGGVRFTPGAGVRFLTPVGPFRLDVAYNPNPPEIGPLYYIYPNAGLVLIDNQYSPAAGGFLSRLRVQFALGQAF